MQVIGEAKAIGPQARFPVSTAVATELVSISEATDLQQAARGAIGSDHDSRLTQLVSEHSLPTAVLWPFQTQMINDLAEMIKSPISFSLALCIRDCSAH
jgi:hypothetical protein